MNYEKCEAKVVSKIDEFATKLAHEIMDGFNLQEQNQAVGIIKSCFRENREKLLQDADNRAEELKGSLQDLDGI